MAAASDDQYVCRLDPETEAKAKKELNEDPKDRLNAVQALRTWIQQQPHLRFTTETRILLYFLRTAKFSQLKAREMIENNARVATMYPDWMRNIDSHDPALLEIIESGYAIPLPKKDKNGCGILLYQPAAMKKSGEMFSVADEVRAGMIIGTYAAMEECVQVNGFVFIFDLSGYSTRHMTRWSIDDMKKWNSTWQNALPGRYKALHYYNAGAIFDTLMAISKPFLTKKIYQRIHLHNTMESLYKSIDMELLPREYLPDDYEGPCVGTSAELIANFKRDVMKPEFRAMVLQQTSESSKGIDESKRPSYKPVNESFRKLAVD